MHPILQELLLGALFFLPGLLLGPAFSNIQRSSGGSTLASVMRAEKARMPRSRVRPRKQSTSDSGDSPLFIIVGFVALATLYMKYRLTVLLAVAALATIVALAATLSVVMMSRHGVLTGGISRTLGLLTLLNASMLGFLVVFLADNPPQDGDLFRAQVERFGRGEGFGSIEGITFVVYQLLGIAAYLAVALLAIAASVAIMAALNRRVSAAGDWLWILLLRGTSAAWSGWALGLGVLLTAISIAASGGWLWSWVGGVHVLGSSLPTPSATPS